MASDTQTPLHFASLTDVARRLERRELSPVDLTRTMLERIETVDARLKSYATVSAERALAAARAAEAEIDGGRYRGPLHGMPVAVKDLCFTKGIPTMAGMAIRKDFVPDRNATVIERLDAAGAVLLGKLALTEGAMVGYHRDFEVPVNPWGSDLWPGASSSGSGVATAAGLCFASLGSDTGGSIRFPSLANGIVGLKPTYGRVSRDGVLDLGETLDHVGPMARAVEDAATVLAAIAGRDPADPTSSKQPVPSFGDLADGVRGLTLGYDAKYATDGTDAELVASIEAALETLRELGAEVREWPSASSGSPSVRTRRTRPTPSTTPRAPRSTARTSATSSRSARASAMRSTPRRWPRGASSARASRPCSARSMRSCVPLAA
jgi:amidase